MINQSEVSRLLAQIDAEFAAAKQGLQGLASGTSKHAFITHKMERIGAYHAELSELIGDPQQAMGLIVQFSNTETKNA
jgi:hypothetical protein